MPQEDSDDDREQARREERARIARDRAALRARIEASLADTRALRKDTARTVAFSHHLMRQAAADRLVRSAPRLPADAVAAALGLDGDAPWVEVPAEVLGAMLQDLLGHKAEAWTGLAVAAWADVTARRLRLSYRFEPVRQVHVFVRKGFLRGPSQGEENSR